MIAQLNEVLTYQNQAVMERYSRDYPHNRLPAAEALKQLGQYLWLCMCHQQDQAAFPDLKDLQFECSMQPEMHEIDDMWHTFLLFTADYMQYCLTYFGKFIHHVPKTGDYSTSPVAFEEELTRYLSYAYDHLGEETLRVWFAEYLNYNVD